MLNYIHGITLPDYMVNEDASIKSCLGSTANKCQVLNSN